MGEVRLEIDHQAAREVLEILEVQRSGLPGSTDESLMV